MKTKFRPLKKWHGNDASNETSLFEYGLLFRKTTVGLRVVYKWYANNGEFRYSYSWFNPDNFKPENTCLELEPVFKCCDSTIEDYSNNPEQFCSDLYNYYGHKNIFGTDYSGGYTENEIKRILNKAKTRAAVTASRERLKFSPVSSLLVKYTSRV